MTSPALEVQRRQLTGRRNESVAKLLEAAVTEITTTGYDGLTVRNVAKAAGVSAATAYTYFASKEHLLAEVWWRRLAALSDPEFAQDSTLAERVRIAVEPIALAVADEPELAAGVTTALLAHDPDVKVLRQQSGDVMAQRLSLALRGEAPEPAALALTMMLLGALIASGMQVLDYHRVPGLLAEFAELVERT